MVKCSTMLFNGMIATLIKQALRCFKRVFKVHKGTQSRHDVPRGPEIGLRLWCTKRSHAVRFSHCIRCVTVLYVMQGNCIRCHNATQTLSCNAVARLKPRYAGWATLCYTTLRSYMK